MGRRRGFFAELEHQRNEQRKQAARLQRENERLALQARREREKRSRETAKADKEKARQAAIEYQQAQRAEVAELNSQLASRIRELEGVLATSLTRSARIPFAKLREAPPAPRFRPGPLTVPADAPTWDQFAPTPGTAVQRLIRRQQTERAERAARYRFEEAVQQHRVSEEARSQRLEAARRSHAAELTAWRRQTEQLEAKVTELEEAYRAGEPAAVNDYFELVLESRVLPTGLPTEVEVAYQAENRRLLVVMELPGVDIIPEYVDYRYVRARNEVMPRARPVREFKQRYSDLVAQLVLATMRDIFDVAPLDLIAEVGVGAHVSTRNRATGRPERPCLVSLLTTREQFAELELGELDPGECLRYLNARISQHPHDLEAVRPVFDPDLSKYKFVPAHDAAAGLDSRSVLLDMDPTEFEQLVRQLFEAMGMRSMVTQASRDDGVDGVAVNEDPIMGGVCVIQAKRYRNIVPADAVRALAGVMGQKKASRGVLITTSWFGKATIDFADDHGRIQLIDGAELKHLLQEHLKLDVMIGELSRRPGQRVRRS